MPAATDALANPTLTPHPQLSKRRKPTSAGRQCVAYGVGLQGGTAGVVQVVTILCKDANGQRRHTGGDVVTLDMRSLKVAHRVAGAHAQAVRSIDYNPNKPYAVLSAGDDYHLRVWDLRKPASPLLAQKAHSHWYARATRRNSAQFGATLCAIRRTDSDALSTTTG